MTMKNYHTHTMRCFHAIGSDEDYVKAAIKAGYSELGFSDHAPFRYHSFFISSMRMGERELKGYVTSLTKLREKYRNQISIKIGLECEYFERYLPWIEEMIVVYGLDYLILGQHYDSTDETGIYFGSKLNRVQLKSYVDQCIKGMNTGLFSYLAHPDLANYNTNDPYYIEQMTRLCKEAKKLDIPLEFNLLGYRTKRQYPNDVFFTIVKNVGNRVIIGTDAHQSESLLDKETYDKAKAHLKEMGIEITEEIRFLR